MDSEEKKILLSKISHRLHIQNIHTKKKSISDTEQEPEKLQIKLKKEINNNLYQS